MIPNLAEQVRELLLCCYCYGDRGRGQGSRGLKLGEAKGNLGRTDNMCFITTDTERKRKTVKCQHFQNKGKYVG